MSGTLLTRSGVALLAGAAACAVLSRRLWLAGHRPAAVLLVGVLLGAVVVANRCALPGGPGARERPDRRRR